MDVSAYFDIITKFALARLAIVFLIAMISSNSSVINLFGSAYLA